MLNNLNLDRLQTFVVAARAVTFAEAARQRGVSVSSVSQQIKALEGQLGQPLFERVGRSVRLTVDGRQLLELAHAHLAALDEAIARFGRASHVIEGDVRLGSPRTFGRVWLEPRIPPLLERYPELSLTLAFEVPSILEQRLTEGALDLAILVRPHESPLLDATVLTQERFIAVCHPKWVSAPTPLDANSLTGWRWLTFDADRPMHDAWWKATFNQRCPALREVARVPSLELLMELAKAGVGAAVLPEYLVSQPLAHGTLVSVPVVARKRATNSLFLAWRRSMVETARFRAVRAALTAGEPVKRGAT